MAQAILLRGGAGGVTSDDVTASKAHVLQGYKTVTTDSDDEVAEGQIVNRGNIVDTAELVNAHWDSKFLARMEQGYYSQNGQYKPCVAIPYAVLANVAGVDISKMLDTLTVAGKQGQIKSINTQDNNYRVNKSQAFGIDGWSDRNNPVFWIDFPHGNGYYHRADNHPHTCIDATSLGTADANSVLQWQTATSVHGVKFEGAIQRWICTTGDVITALGGEGFAWDDTHANRGRGIVVRIPNGFYIQGANWAFLPSPNHLPHNIRKDVNINGTIGTMEDYGAGRVAFRNATFDGTLVSGVANIGLGNNLNVYSKPSTEIRDGIIRFYNGGSVSGGGLHQYRSNAVLEEAVTLAHSVNLTPFKTIRLGLKYPYGGKWGTTGGLGSLTGVLWALPTTITPDYVPSRNSKIHAGVIKRVGYKDGVIPMAQGQWGTPTEIPVGAEYFVDIDVSDLQGHHRIVLGIAVSEANHNENLTIQVSVYVNNGISGISHIEFIN